MGVVHGPLVAQEGPRTHIVLWRHRNDRRGTQADIMRPSEPPPWARCLAASIVLQAQRDMARLYAYHRGWISKTALLGLGSKLTVDEFEHDLHLAFEQSIVDIARVAGITGRDDEIRKRLVQAAHTLAVEVYRTGGRPTTKTIYKG